MLRFDLNVVWTVINMLIIYLLIRRFLFKPVNKILAQRREEIDKQFSDAKSTEDEAKGLKLQYEEALSNVSSEKLQIINEARTKACEDYEKILDGAKAQADKVISDAERLADREQEKRMRQAQSQLADMVVAAASKIAASKTSSESDRELYNQFLAKAGEKSE